MTVARRRGGAPVGYLEELEPLEAAAVIYLRLWCAGDAEQARVREDFELMLGGRRGDAAARGLAALVDVLHNHGRRPLMRHGVGCKCLGGDEAAFANMISAAVCEDREDAVLLASLFLRPDMAHCAVAMAQEFGFAVKRLSRLVQSAGKGAIDRAPQSTMVH